MPVPTSLTQYNNFKIEQGLANVNYALNDLRSKYNSFVKLLGTTDGITSKRIKRIEDYLTADVQKFNQISVRSLAAITGTIGGWTIDAASIRNTASTVKLRGAGNLAFGATPPTAAVTGTGIFIDDTGIYGLNANTQEAYLRASDGQIIAGAGAVVLSATGVVATAGTIGGWTLGATSLTAGAGANTTGVDSGGTNPAFYAGSATPGAAPFRVTQAGALVATSATITGTITASAGTIGAWTIDATSIRNAGSTAMLRGAGNLAFGATPPTSATVGTGVFIDDTGVFGLSANTQNFKLVATDGSITAIKGTVGGWALAATTLVGGNATLSNTGVLTLGTTNDVVIASAADATYRLWAGNATAASAPFRVTKAGELTATSATISGSITATSGSVGGWTVDSDSINNAGGTVTMRGAGNLAFGATPPTSATVGTGVYVDDTGLFGLSANTQNFAISATDGSITSIKGTIGTWTIDSTSIRNAASTAILRGAGNLAFGATPPTSATVGTGLFLDSTGLYGLNANTQEFYVKATDGKGYFGTGAAILSTLGLTLTTPAYIAIGATPPTGAAAGTGTYIDATGFYNVSSDSTTVAIQPTVVALTNTINDINISKSSGSWYGLNLTMIATAPVTLLEGIEISVSGGTPTDAKGIYISQIASGTNRKGVHIGTIAAGANNYALYSEALAQSVHAGNLRIGSTVAPTVALDVTGSFTLSGTATIGSLSGVLKASTGVVSGSAVLNDVGAATGDYSINSHKLTNVTDPTSAQDAATKAYVDTVATGLSPKASVRLASAAALPAVTYANGASGVGATLTAVALGALTVDGSATALNDRLLIKDQVAGLQNGIYTVTTLGSAGVAFILTRATDSDLSAEIFGAYVFVETGTVNSSSGWVNSNATAPTMGTDAINFTQFTGLGEVTAGAGLTKTGNTLDAVGTASRILVNADSIDIASDYVGQASITTLGTITTGTWNAGGVTISGAAGLSMTQTLAPPTGNATSVSVAQTASGTPAAGYTLTGFKANSTWSATVAATKVVGVDVTASASGATALATAVSAVQIVAIASGGATVSGDIAGIEVVSVSGSGGKNIGAKIASPAASANNYALYIDATAQSVHAGNLRIGSVTAPTVALDVTGAALISSTLGVTAALSAASVAATGVIKSSGATSGVGYATGAGGTVTQTGSKTTTVVLNTICGHVVTHNAALAAGATAIFQVTNSNCENADAVIVTLNDTAAMTNNAYTVRVAQAVSGGFNVALTNITAGSLSEAVTINIMILKGVIA